MELEKDNYYTGFIGEKLDKTLYLPLTLANPYNKKTVNCLAVVDTGFTGSILITQEIKDFMDFHPAQHRFQKTEGFTEGKYVPMLDYKTGRLDVSIPLIRAQEPAHVYDFTRMTRGFYARAPEAESKVTTILVGLPFLQEFEFDILINGDAIPGVRGRKTLVKACNPNDLKLWEGNIDSLWCKSLEIELAGTEDEMSAISE